MKKIVGLIFSFVIFALFANAGEVVQQKDVNEINNMAKPVVIEDAGDSVEDCISKAHGSSVWRCTCKCL